jgi:cytoskeletal protein RodZ
MAYKILFFYIELRGGNLKEIGEALKDARENMGLSIEEVAGDLKLRPSQVENIEAGNIDAFKDVFYLKYFIKDYAKYLGLSYDDLIDEFNEYLFDYTSKISLEDIKKAQKKEDKKAKKQKRIASPYTIERRSRINFKIILIILLIMLALLISIFTIKSVINSKSDTPIDNVIR